MRELPDVVVAVGPGAVQRAHADAPAAAVVAVVEAREHRGVGLVVHQMQQLPGGVVAVSRVNAVAERLEGDPAGGVVLIQDHLRAALVGDPRQAADGVELIGQLMAELIGTGRAPAPAVVGVGEPAPAGAGIVDARQVVVGIVGERRRTCGVGGAGQVATRVVQVVDVRAVGIGLARDLAVTVVGEADRRAAAVGPRSRLAKAVVGPAFLAAVGVGDVGQVAVAIVVVVGEVAVGVGQLVEAVEVRRVGEARGIAHRVREARQVVVRVVQEQTGPAGRVGDAAQVAVCVQRQQYRVAEWVGALEDRSPVVEEKLRGVPQGVGRGHRASGVIAERDLLGTAVAVSAGQAAMAVVGVGAVTAIGEGDFAEGVFLGRALAGDVRVAGEAAIVVLDGEQVLVRCVVGVKRLPTVTIGDAGDAPGAVIGQSEGLAGGMRQPGQIGAGVGAVDAVAVGVAHEVELAVGTEVVLRAVGFGQHERAPDIRGKDPVVAGGSSVVGREGGGTGCWPGRQQ